MRKTSGAGGVLGGVGGVRGRSFNTGGEPGTQREKGGIMVSEMASASWSKVKSHDGDGVPLSREKYPSCSQI